MIVWIIIMTINNVNSAEVHTLVNTEIGRNVDASKVTKFPGSGIILGTGKPITEEIAKRVELQKMAMAMREAVKTAPTTVCTRSGKMCGEAATVAVKEVFGEGLKNIPKSPTPISSPSLPIGTAIGAAFLAKDVIQIQKEKGNKAAVIKAIGGSGTLAASIAAGSSCAAMAAPTGPIGSLVAGIACSLPVAFVGDQITDEIIEQQMDVNEDVQVDDSWIPTQDQIDKCQDYLDQATEKFNSMNDLDLNTKRREMIKWIMENIKRHDNPLMPEECQYVVLHQMLDSLNMKDLSNSDWLEMLR